MMHHTIDFLHAPINLTMFGCLSLDNIITSCTNCCSNACALSGSFSGFSSSLMATSSPLYVPRYSFPKAPWAKGTPMSNLPKSMAHSS
ncbi:Os02g0174250 [Oryza sativa Japonica Group]|uniref:Os02g0174250 protein n=1 Tax=Oryza sativa subsp. japonica TaxID=39947 RepID=A0A0P0VFK5_ORYSJ|nr:hypothetical protein EE612_009170 [Oryza sativa]BAS77232.1 Os02g0174250 [Oryza sativa Japonica Group]